MSRFDKYITINGAVLDSQEAAQLFLDAEDLRRQLLAINLKDTYSKDILEEFIKRIEDDRVACLEHMVRY